MIDFKIKGTKLPQIGIIEYRCSHWGSISNGESEFSHKNLYSWGCQFHDGENYIKAETRDYDGPFYYMFKESDIIKLAKEQGMIDNFVLPKMWYVENPNNSESKLLYKWFNDGCNNQTWYNSGDCFLFPNFENKDGFDLGK